MRPVRPVQRSFLGQCLHDLLDLVGCGLLWATLVGLIILQAWVLLSGELKLPDFLHKALQSQLAEQGLKAEYSRVLMDPSGSVLVENISLATPENPDPLATARTLLVRLDPWQLLTGKVQITDIEGSGLNVLIPAYLSPSGRPDAVLAEAQFRLHFEAGRQLTLDAVSGRIAGLPVALDGSYTLAAPAPKSGKVSARLPDLTPFYTIARQLLTIGEQLRPLGEMSIRGRVALDQVILTARAPSIDLSKLPESPLPPLIGNARNVTLRLALPFALDGHPEAVAGIEHFEVTLPDIPPVSLERLQARLTGDTLIKWNNWPALRLSVCAGELSSGPFTLSSTGIEAMPPGPEQAFAVSLNSRLDGEPWHIRMTGLPDNSGALVEVEGHPTAGLLTNLEPLVPITPSLTTLLSLGPPPLLTLRAELGRGGIPTRIEGHLEGGGAVAYHVPIDEASADFVWQGEELSFTDMLLRLNKSEARGSYSMNIHTHDFRFLLTGHLNPPDIGGWFHGWWDTFWADFNFPTPAEAQVEVRGQWGDPYGTTVFVAAEAKEPNLRQQPLAYLRTRLFIRPGWYDALDFYARDADGAAADGRFGLSMDLDGEGWQSIDFDFTSNLPKVELGRLLGATAVEIFEPYKFTTPPHLRISGSATAPDRRDITLWASTDLPFTFHDYTVQDLDLQGRMIDDVLTLDPMRAHFADGLLTGRAVISGPEGNRWLALDHHLENARLDAVLDIIADREKAQSDPLLKPSTTIPRRPGGILTLTLQANGALDQPTRLNGNGKASIKDARFANISLLGKLSDVMKSTGLGFTSLSLENLTTSYRMADGTINFPNLRLTGPSAAVDSSGHYFIDDQTLDFRAKLFPYESSSGFIGNTADFVLSPLSKALEFRLIGNLEKPDWSFSYGPRGLLRALTGEGQTPATTKPASNAVKP